MDFFKRPHPHLNQHLVQDAVERVQAYVVQSLKATGYRGPHYDILLSSEQHDYLAGYIFGALRKVMEIGGTADEAFMEEACIRLYTRLFGQKNQFCRTWHVWVVEEGLRQMRRPHVFFGYHRGRHDMIAQLRSPGAASSLADALRNLRHAKPQSTAN